MKINNKFGKSLAALVVSCAISTSVFAELTPEPRGNDPHMAVSAGTVAMAVRALGHDVKRHTDKEGNPHFVVTDKIAGAESVAIFMDDCGTAGCEDLVLYANLGKKGSLSADQMNAWNHISSKLRSKVGRSDNGEIAQSMTLSFYDDQDHKKMAMMIGMFFAEVTMMSATLDMK